MAQNNANQKLNDLLISKNFDPQSLNNHGKPATSPEEADLFSFNYTGESGQDYGTVVIMLNDENDLNVYFGDNIGKSMEGDDKKGWFDFLYQLRMFAKRNLFSFTLQNLNKLKYSMQGQAAISEGLFESWQGKKDISWNADATQARLMIKHKRNIGEGEARFRNIQSLFIETSDGERFKLPFTKLSAGRAMLEHVRQGGKPYDVRGNHIVTIVEEMNLLSRFRRANQGKIFEGETQQLVEQATHYYETLQSNLKSLGTKIGYTKYFESWNPAALTDEDVIIEDLRHMFIEQNIDSRIEQALPLLAKLQQEHNMKEANIFENWTNLILEGTWAIPDTKEKQTALVTLLSQELPVGADATNATELLYDLLGDDELFDRLEELADQDANADAREIILTRLEELKNNPDIAQVIGQLKTPQDQEELGEYVAGVGGQREFKNGQWVHVPKQANAPVRETFDTDEVSPVESAIINRITMAHTDLLAKFGPEAVMNAARDQADFVGDVDEIGSSDVSGWVKNVIRDLESSNQGVEELEESAMSEVDILFQEIARNNVDIYDIYANPKTDIEKFVSDQIREKVDELMIDPGYHKDDIEKMLQIIYDDIAKDYDIDETVGGGNWLEENGSIVDQMTKIQDEIEKIVRSGGRVPLNDPLSRKLKMLKNKLHKSKGVNENTALTGPYGHSGKLEPVEGTDEDMMARIKFLAGIRETDTTTNGQEDSNLTAMKSVSSIFLR